MSIIRASTDKEFKQRQRYAKRLAKDLKWTKEDWHERGGECCSYSEEPLASFGVKTDAVCEWYCKVTLVSADRINVKVCYRLTGMSGYQHLDLQLPSDSHYINIHDTVRLLKSFAWEAFNNALRIERVLTHRSSSNVEH